MHRISSVKADGAPSVRFIIFNGFVELQGSLAKQLILIKQSRGRNQF